MRKRILGFDIARAYAILGMFIVNFNFCFGSFQDQSFLGKSLNLITGNSTAIFIICAGMGVSLMTNNVNYNSLKDKEKFKSNDIEIINGLNGFKPGLFDQFINSIK